MAKVKETKPSTVVAGLMMLCPMTGNSLFGSKIKPHSLVVQKCKNGSLTTVCRVHSIRVFITDPTIVGELIGELYAT